MNLLSMVFRIFIGWHHTSTAATHFLSYPHDTGDELGATRHAKVQQIIV